MRVTIIKEDRFDRMELRRDDGTDAVSRFPKKGPVPHDAVHYYVEAGLCLVNGFWGMIASGRHPEDVQEIAKAGGHASSKRAGIPDADIVALLQAERLVECFEASLWDGRIDPAGFRDVARAACEASHVPLPDLSDDAILGIAAQMSALNAEWSAAPPGHSISFDWPER
jgi:hypothetical protein